MIEVGDYIKDKEGNITRIFNLLNLDREVYLYLGEDGYQYSDNAIKSHSKNIIDLIEVGDYVNGYRVVDIMEDMETGEIHLEMTSDYTNETIGDCTIYNDDIKSIVTHEQFSSIEYKVGGEDE